MRRYFILTLAAAAIYLGLHFSICLFLPAPLPAEYWMGDSIAIKRMLARSLPSPRIIFLGGSSTLFGVDVRQVEKGLGLPAINMGMHAAMRLDRVLGAGEDMARRGDILVVILEPPYYGCDQASWSDWQLENALTWDRPYFDRLPLGTRIKAVFTAGGPCLMFEVLADKLGSLVFPAQYGARLEALEPVDSIWERYRSGAFRTNAFGYSGYNLDDRGDIVGNEGPLYSGPSGSTLEPAGICPTVLSALADFVSRMHSRGVRVIVGHTPYLIDGVVPSGWRQAETQFVRDIASAGASILDSRDELFFPRPDFFNTPLHLNTAGRHRRTESIIIDLRKLGVGLQND
jgi:hypothetical protein